MNGLCWPRNTGAAAMHGSIIFTLCALVSCAPKNSKKSSAKEFENSANICLAISNFAANRSKLDGNQDPERIFADKKLSERRILVDLIGSYQGVLANLEAPAVKPPATPDSQSVVSSGKP
jgi:hypothetical protein